MCRHNIVVSIILFAALLGVVTIHDTPVTANDSQSSTATTVKPLNHSILLQIQQAVSVDNKDGTEVYELKVRRWYGNIPQDVLEPTLSHETQEFNILFPVPAGTIVKVGDILEYRITRYLSGAEGKTDFHEIPVQLDHTAWVQKCLKDLSQIKPGMRRSEVENMFPQDGGWADAGEHRFVHPECPCIKVDVEFSFQRDEKDQGRAITSPEDPVTTVSRPYLQYPIAD